VFISAQLNQAEYPIPILVVAPQEYVNIDSTRRALIINKDVYWYNESENAILTPAMSRP